MSTATNPGVLAVIDRLSVNADPVEFGRTVARLRAAVARLIEDNRAALRMLADDGMEDSPVAGFLRAALARVPGGAA